MRIIWTLGACVATAATAGAGEVIQSGRVPLQRTNWNAVVALDPFDDQGGTRVLESVRWSLEAFVEGAARAESFDAVPATVTLELGAAVEATLAGRTLAESAPVIGETFLADAFDGIFDFDGDSGAAFEAMSGSQRLAGIDLDPADFLGPDPITLGLEATGVSRAVGGGSLAAEFDTRAGATWEVTYLYRVVPAPGGALLAGASLLLLRRRRARSTQESQR